MMDTLLAVIIAGLMLLFAIKVVSAILKSELFWIFIGLVILIGIFSDRNKSTDITHKQDNDTYTVSEDNYLEEGSLFCLSEAAYNKQTELLASGISEYAPHCFSAARDIKVQIQDFKVIGGIAKVVGIENGKEMWTAAESLANK